MVGIHFESDYLQSSSKTLFFSKSQVNKITLAE